MQSIFQKFQALIGKIKQRDEGRKKDDGGRDKDDGGYDKDNGSRDKDDGDRGKNNDPKVQIKKVRKNSSHSGSAGEKKRLKKTAVSVDTAKKIFVCLPAHFFFNINRIVLISPISNDQAESDFLTL